MNTLSTLFVGLSALGGLGGLAAFFYVRATRSEINARARKHHIEADVLVAQQTMELYDRVATEARDATRRAATAMRRVRALEEHVVVLNSIVRALGGDPPPFAAEEDSDWHGPD